MTMQLRKATRQKAKIRLGLSGPSGSGKTVSALRIGYGITGDWEKVAVLDTENGSADLYANHTLSDGSKIGEFLVLRLERPFSPERYIEAMKTCFEAGIEVLIVDSITHEWDGPGGCLEIYEKMGGKYQDWAKITPRHQSFIQTILDAPCHVITTVRRKQDYEMVKDGNGKVTVHKVGLKEVTREGFEYEVTTNLEIDIHHNAMAGKDRTGLFAGQPSFTPSEETGRLILEWCESGEDISVQVSAAIMKVGTCDTPDELQLLTETLSPLVSQNKSVVDAVNTRMAWLRAEHNTNAASELAKELSTVETPEGLTLLVADVNSFPDPFKKGLRLKVAEKAQAMGWTWNAEHNHFEVKPPDQELPLETSTPAANGAPTDQTAQQSPAANNAETAPADSTPKAVVENPAMEKPAAEKSTDEIVAEYKPKIQAVETPDALTKMLTEVNGLPLEAAKALRRTVSAKAKNSGWVANPDKSGFMVADGSDGAQQQQPAPTPQEGGEAASPENQTATPSQPAETPAAAPAPETPAPAPVNPTAQSQKLEWFKERVGKRIWMQGLPNRPDHYTGVYPAQAGVLLTDQFPDYLLKLQQTEGYTFRDLIAGEDAAVA